jgi:hypothetical protein
VGPVVASRGATRRSGRLGRGRRALPGVAVGIALLAAGGAPAQDPGARPVAQARPAVPAARPPAAQPADPAFEAARAAFEALPEAERKGLQDALVWTGDFNAVVSGAFGRRTFEAVNAFHARSGGTGLDPRARAAILAAGEAARRAARFRVAPDSGSGAVVGVPETLLSKRTSLPAGTRWQSADGRVTLETRAYPPGTETLDGLFERATAPLNDRKVTYKLRRPDFFVVTGETGPGLSYTRYSAGPQGVRGFLIGYDRALAGEVDRLVIAVANAFDPFPAGAAPAAAPAAGPATVPAALAAPRVAATGLTVAPGRVLTASSALEGCAEPRVGGTAARVLATDPSGLALLEVTGGPAPALPPPRAEPTAPGEGLIAVAAGADGVSVAPGGAGAGSLTAPLQPGAAGAPVLDRSGRLAGLVARYPAAPRLVAGVAPPTSVPLVPAAAVSAFLAGRGVGAGTLGATGPGAVAPAVVGIACR